MPTSISLCSKKSLPPLSSDGRHQHQLSHSQHHPQSVSKRAGPLDRSPRSKAATAASASAASDSQCMISPTISTTRSSPIQLTSADLMKASSMSQSVNEKNMILRNPAMSTSSPSSRHGMLSVPTSRNGLMPLAGRRESLVAPSNNKKGKKLVGGCERQSVRDRQSVK